MVKHWIFCFWFLAALAVADTPSADRKLEMFVLLPEPWVLRSERSLRPKGAEKTALSPAYELAGVPWVATYDKAEFLKLGISPETFAERAKKVADRRLAGLKPDFIRDAEGRVNYAAYRGSSPLIASLLVAPSLPAVFEKVLGPEIWVVLPDRHSLFVFPPKAEALEEFVADLAERYRSNPHAASPEIFAIKLGGEPRVVGAFSE